MRQHAESTHLNACPRDDGIPGRLQTDERCKKSHRRERKAYMAALWEAHVHKSETPA